MGVFCIFCGQMMKLDGKQYICSCRRVEAKSFTINFEVGKAQETGSGVADAERNLLAVYDHTCSQCGYGKAQLISKGVAISDEDELVEMVCGSCGHHDVEDGLKPF
jgi:DNA-directed RNA polymerase subunit M/transcription elongation factor TFIIS